MLVIVYVGEVNFNLVIGALHIILFFYFYDQVDSPPTSLGDLDTQFDSCKIPAHPVVRMTENITCSGGGFAKKIRLMVRQHTIDTIKNYKIIHN